MRKSVWSMGNRDGEREREEGEERREVGTEERTIPEPSSILLPLPPSLISFPRLSTPHTLYPSKRLRLSSTHIAKGSPAIDSKETQDVGGERGRTVGRER